MGMAMFVTYIVFGSACMSMITEFQGLFPTHFVLVMWPSRVTRITVHAISLHSGLVGRGIFVISQLGTVQWIPRPSAILQSSDHISRHHVMPYWFPSKEGITSHSVPHSHRIMESCLNETKNGKSICISELVFSILKLTTGICPVHYHDLDTQHDDTRFSGSGWSLLRWQGDNVSSHTRGKLLFQTDRRQCIWNSKHSNCINFLSALYIPSFALVCHLPE